MEDMIKDVRLPIVKLRKVVKSGDSYYISLPRVFMELNGIKKGDRLPVLAGQHILKVVPMNEE